jgi:misacylated tRNA(Ala) deacylase
MDAKLLYLEDAYTAEFTAEITDLEEDGVGLSATAFYPGGGGQPCDVGWLVSQEGETFHVRQVKKEGGAVRHFIDTGGLRLGATVTGRLDWERRYQLMRTHTAMHILCGVIWRDYGASVTGGNMEPLKGRMDFEFERMRQELVQEIEDRVNVEIEASRPLRTAILPRQEAFAIPDLIRTKINLLPPAIAEVRVVEIVGLDLQADGGTHVGNTREVGPIQIVDYKSKGAINKRLVVGLAAEVKHV